MIDKKELCNFLVEAKKSTYAAGDLAQKIIDATNSKSKIVHLPPLKDGDMLRRCPDNTKMRVLLGRELITIDEGIKKLLDSPQFQK
jgi:UDP-glucose 4-epimerase